jgi:hypothetical protein
VRKLAGLALYFSLGFAMLFLVMTAMRHMAIRPELSGPVWNWDGLKDSARWALSFAIYGGMLVGLTYTVRNGVFAPAAIMCVSILALCLAIAADRFIENLRPAPASAGGLADSGETGLILGSRESGQGAAFVLLRGPDESGGAGVVVAPGSPMVFRGDFSGRENPESGLSVPGLGSPTPWFLQSAAIDLGLSADNLRLRFGEGMRSFLLYAGSLVFVLGSLVFVFRLGEWPLANFFLGVLAFRGVLALEALFNSREMQDVFASHVGERLSLSLVVPAIFMAAGTLAHLYSILMYVVKKQARHAVV